MPYFRKLFELRSYSGLLLTGILVTVTAILVFLVLTNSTQGLPGKNGKESNAALSKAIQSPISIQQESRPPAPPQKPAPLDVEKTLKRIQDLLKENPEGNRLAVTELIILLSESNVSAAYSAISTLPENYGTWVFLDFHRRLVRKDPEASREWLSHFVPKNGNQVKMASNIFGLLCKTDLNEAFNCIKDQTPENRIEFLRNGMWLWSSGKNTLEALNQIHSHLSEPEYDAAFSAIIVGNAYNAPNESLKILNDMDAAAKNKLLPDVIGAWVETEGVIAVVNTLATEDPSVIYKVLNRTRRDGNQTILLELINKSPEQGIELLSKIPLTSENLKMFEDSARALGRTNPERFKEWIATFPPSDSRATLLKAGSVK